MPVLADPIVRTKLMEFRATVDELIRSASLLTAERRVSVIRELCQLSRDTKFDLGSIRFADAEQARDVACCFEKSVLDIRGMWPAEQVPAEVEGYCENILRRAARCRISD